MKIFLLNFLMIFTLPTANSQSLSFYKENLTFRIMDSTFYVSGNYYLKKNQIQQKQTTLFYQLPTDSIYFPVDSFYIYNITTNEEIKNIKKTTNGIIFPVTLNNETILFISYQQKLKLNKAKYILKTTRYWKKPFEEASYKLITPEGLKILKFSFNPDKEENISNKKIYYWERKNFMPSTDMEFEFE